MSIKLLFNEFVSINQDRKGIYRNQAKIDFPNGPEDPYNIDIILTPFEGFYRGARIVFRMKLPTNYPESPPGSVLCKTKIFHPNITFDGRVCFNMFSGDWNRSYRLEQYINGLLWLLANPNPDSALNGAAADRDMQVFEKNAQLAMNGIPVKGNNFEPFLNTDFNDPTMLQHLKLSFLEVFGFLVARSQPNQAIAMKDILTSTYGKLIPDDDSWFNALRNLDVKFFRNSIKRRLYGIQARADTFIVESKNVIKEIIFVVNGMPVLVLAAGFDQIDVSRMAQLLNVNQDSITLAKRATIKGLIGFDVTQVPSFGYPANTFQHILISSYIDSDEKFITASHHPSLYLEMKGKDLIQCVGSSACVASALQKPVLRPLVLETETPNIQLEIQLEKQVTQLQSLSLVTVV
eukprot:TRINITY_DN8935_c0_g1_i1.p1 TRINITY_DN8935_c0_g1~~TRINITY_DN8935_c0_g1_i1.p1  ORF type:complete len:405 (+),score=129.29 TRINITY_DN8935_c0_g1_i1:63-1277(+)